MQEDYQQELKKQVKMRGIFNTKNNDLANTEIGFSLLLVKYS